MTADMAFEGLIVSHDAALYSVFDRVLRQLSISTNVCLSASKACSQLKEGSTDLLVIDCDGQDWSEVLDRVWASRSTKKPTVVAITRKEERVPGAHVVLKRPVTVENGALSLKAAYHRMLHDYRQHARYALMTPVVATDAGEKTVCVTVTDIGDRGIGISSKEQLAVGTVLRFRLQLPGAPREILVEARVLWTREYGRSGCEFVRVPPVDAMVLHDWLKSRIRVKKPLVEM